MEIVLPELTVAIHEENLQAIIPGGSSVPLLTKDKCEEAIMDFDGLMSLQSGLGTAAVIVINKDHDIIKVKKKHIFC